MHFILILIKTNWFNRQIFQIEVELILHCFTIRFQFRNLVETSLKCDHFSSNCEFKYPQANQFILLWKFIVKFWPSNKFKCNKSQVRIKEKSNKIKQNVFRKRKRKKNEQKRNAFSPLPMYYCFVHRMQTLFFLLLLHCY